MPTYEVIVCRQVTQSARFIVEAISSSDINLALIKQQEPPIWDQLEWPWGHPCEIPFHITNIERIDNDTSP